MPSARSRFWCPGAPPTAKSAHRSRRSEHRGAAVGRTDLSLGRQCKRIGSFGNITVKTDGLTVVVEVVRLHVTGRVVDELQADPHLLATLASIHTVQPGHSRGLRDAPRPICTNTCSLNYTDESRDGQARQQYTRAVASALGRRGNWRGNPKGRKRWSARRRLTRR